MYIRLHCLRVLWNLSTFFQNLKIILQSRPSVFKFNLKRAVIFLHKNFRICNRSKQGELVPTHKFWIRFFKSDFKNDCWASPKPDIQHINCATAYLNRRLISKFLVEKIVSKKSSLIHSILHKTGTITSGFEGKKRKYHFLKNRAILWYALFRAVHRTGPTRSGLLPQNRTWYVLKYLFECDRLSTSPSNLENHMTVCMRYPAMTSQERAGKRRWKGAGSLCRESGTQNLKSRWYAKPEPAVPILPWNSLRIF